MDKNIKNVIEMCLLTADQRPTASDLQNHEFFVIDEKVEKEHLQLQIKSESLNLGELGNKTKMTCLMQNNMKNISLVDLLEIDNKIPQNPEKKLSIKLGIKDTITNSIR